jgi:transposase-like protein
VILETGRFFVSSAVIAVPTTALSCGPVAHQTLVAPLARYVIEQDHRRIKQRVRPTLGFKRFQTAAVAIRGIELAEKIKKGQFNIRPLTGKATTAPEMRARVLAA